MSRRPGQSRCLASSRPTLHTSFTGGPGTGKTTVALRMAQMLHAMGYIRSPKVPENERDYGQEVIEILLQEMEIDRASLLVIFAGYPDRMGAFFSANQPVLTVPHHIGFEAYSHGELVQIAQLMVATENFRFDEPAGKAFAEYLDLRMEQPRFANARSVRNAVERCRLRQAKRLVELDRPLTKDDLVTLTDEDVYGSSVFDAAEVQADTRATRPEDA